MTGPAGIHWPSPHEPSATAYKAGCRHQACRTAAYRAESSSRAKARARAASDPSLISHGVIGGYTYWGCKCGACCEAHRVDKAASVARCKQRRGESLTAYDLEVLLAWERRKAVAA